MAEATSQHPYLAGYVEGLPERPGYVEGLDLAVGSKREPNLIYPLGMGIYVHIRVGGEIGECNLIEPPAPPRQLLDRVESVVAKRVGDLGKLEVGDDPESHEQILTTLFRKAAKKELNIPKEEQDIVLYHFLRDKIRHGFLDGFLEDPWLEDISIPGAGNVFVYHKVYGSLKTNVVVSGEEVDRLLKGIAERYGKILSYTNPIIDIHLPDGSRFNVVFGEDISLKGSNFTIRKFSKDPISVAHLVRFGTISETLAAYMWMLLDVGLSCFFCGETASGKTTSMNAFLGLVRSDMKIVSIEETPEVNIFHKNWVREVTRIYTGTIVTMFDLLKAALRQRPDYIVVGEIRGEEGAITFQAIETGHPVVTTMHAGSLGQLFQRLTSDPINVPKSHIDGLNMAFFQARMERGTKLVRRVISVNEIIGYDSEEGQLNYMPTFIYDSDIDMLRFMGSSYLIETKVLPFRGWSKDRLPELYEELKRRAEIIKYLTENHPSYADIWRTAIEVEHQGIDAVYSTVREGRAPWS